MEKNLMEEFHTEEMTSLIELLARETRVVSVNSCVWACVWLSDLSTLKEMVEDMKDSSTGNRVRFFSRSRETANVIKSCEFRMLIYTPK
jgi:hypothetical protein